LNEGEEKQATLAKGRQKKPAKKKTASSVPEETLPRQGSTPLNGVAEVTHRPDTAPAEFRSLPRDKSPPPQPEGARRKKAHRGMKTRALQEHQEAVKLDRPLGPPSDSVDPVTERGDSDVGATSKISGDGPISPKKEIIDLTIKEESRPGTPVPPSRTPESKEGPAGLKAGWVRFTVPLTLHTL